MMISTSGPRPSHVRVPLRPESRTPTTRGEGSVQPEEGSVQLPTFSSFAVSPRDRGSSETRSSGSSNPQAPIPVSGSGNVYIGSFSGLLGPRTEKQAVLAHDGTLVGEGREHLAVADGAEGIIDLRSNKQANTIEFGGTAEGTLGSTIKILADRNDRIKTKLPLGKDQAVSVETSVYRDGAGWAFTLQRGENKMTIQARTWRALKSVINNSDMDEELKKELLESGKALLKNEEAEQGASSSSSTSSPPTNSRLF